MKNPHHYLCPTDEDPDRRRTVVRDGELLIGILAEVLAEMSPDELEAIEEEDVSCGDGIERVESRFEWRARVPGVGYLELEEGDVPRVVPAVTVTPDHMVAYLDLRSPTGDEQAVQLTEIYQAIRQAGVVHGFSSGHLQAAWKMFQANGGLPCPIRIASGTRPRMGREARLEWDIDVEQHVGRVNSDQGRIDFYERHFVPNVRGGQRLAVWYPGAEPQPGRGVDGVELLGEGTGDTGRILAGENIHLREAANGSIVLEAATDGMLFFDDKGVPRVSDTLEVPGDVCLETGNVDAMGSVVVRGAVRSDLRVTATQNLHVLGVIEAAEIEVGGNLEVGAGIVGDAGSHIVVGGDVTIKYSQNTNLRCGGSVRILDSDMNSKIECRAALSATEGRGRLRGGTYLAGESIMVREAGSELGAPTVLSVGIEGKADAELQAVRRALRDVLARQRLCRRQELPFSRKMCGPGSTTVLRARPKVGRELARQEAALGLKLNRLEKRCGKSDQCSITVLGRIHYGVEIVLCGRRLAIKGETGGRRYFLDPYTREIEAQLL